MEDRYSKGFPARQLSDKPNLTVPHDRTDTTLLQSALSGTNFDQEQLRQVERKIARRVTESVEQLGEIIKDYTKKQ